MNYIYKLVKGYVISVILFLLLTVIMTAFIKFTSIPEVFSFYYLLFAMSVATLFLGVFAGKTIGKNGLLCALCLSAVFVFLLILSITCTYFQELSPDNFSMMYLIPVAIGGMGGIIGVNVKK